MQKYCTKPKLNVYFQSYDIFFSQIHNLVAFLSFTQPLETEPQFNSTAGDREIMNLPFYGISKDIYVECMIVCLISFSALMAEVIDMESTSHLQQIGLTWFSTHTQHGDDSRLSPLSYGVFKVYRVAFNRQLHVLRGLKWLIGNVRQVWP